MVPPNTLEIYVGQCLQLHRQCTHRYKIVYSPEAAKTGALAILLNLKPLAEMGSGRPPVPKTGAQVGRDPAAPNPRAPVQPAKC